MKFTVAPVRKCESKYGFIVTLDVRRIGKAGQPGFGLLLKFAVQVRVSPRQRANHATRLKINEIGLGHLIGVVDPPRRQIPRGDDVINLPVQLRFDGSGLLRAAAR